MPPHRLTGQYGQVHQASIPRCELETARCRVGPWHALADRAGLALDEVVAAMLTPATTEALPEAWSGDYSDDRARAWIAERDRESPTLLVIDRATSRPWGLVILYGLPVDGDRLDLRIGYLLAESAWGQGLATELVTGLVHWARGQPSIQTMTGGVAVTNPASARVLVKNGFSRIELTDEGEAIFRLRVDADRSVG